MEPATWKLLATIISNYGYGMVAGGAIQVFWQSASLTYPSVGVIILGGLVMQLFALYIAPRGEAA